jgi:hypothetical protein
MIPFLNLKSINAQHREEILQSIIDVVDSGYRNELIQDLNKYSIGSIVHYPIPPHHQEWADRSFPISEAIHNEVVSLPIDPTFSRGDIEAIIERLNAFKITEEGLLTPWAGELRLQDPANSPLLAFLRPNQPSILCAIQA